jgi:sugar O-acyltransferase (sialic acid O-acetyltransferase NeuD family)
MTARGNAAPLIILGAGGTGSDILSWIQGGEIRDEPYQCIGLLDDDPAKWGARIEGVPVLGAIREAATWNQAWFADALGSPANYLTRSQTVCAVPQERFATLAHKDCYVSQRSTIGQGCIVYPHVVIAAGVRVGSHVSLLANVVLNHDVRLGDYTIVASGTNISGCVTIGSNCYIGSGAQIIQNVSIGDGALVGMGSVVLRGVPANSVVAGNPARILRTTPGH